MTLGQYLKTVKGFFENSEFLKTGGDPPATKPAGLASL